MAETSRLSPLARCAWFWSNCYLHPFDGFVTRELGCLGYLRYVDHFVTLR